VIDDLRTVSGDEPVDATSLLMHPAHGLRAVAGAASIAQHEWAAARAGSAVLRVVRGAEPGRTERRGRGLDGLRGEPLSMHPIVASGGPGEPINGLRSPRGRRFERGRRHHLRYRLLGFALLSGGVARGRSDQSFVDEVVRPYFAAIATWYRTVAPGVAGGAVHDAIHRVLEETGAEFRPMLNPGHLIGADEWMHSPIRLGSE
jgi:Xaa-Pro aminopeptidase